MRFLIALIVLNEVFSENYVRCFSCGIKTPGAVWIIISGRNRIFDKATQPLQNSIYRTILNT